MRFALVLLALAGCGPAVTPDAGPPEPGALCTGTQNACSADAGYLLGCADGGSWAIVSTCGCLSPGRNTDGGCAPACHYVASAQQLWCNQ